MAIRTCRLQGRAEGHHERDQSVCKPLADTGVNDDRGVWDGLSAQEAMETYPDEWERFLADPYAHRAPRAESYHDLSGEITRRNGLKELIFGSSTRTLHLRA